MGIPMTPESTETIRRLRVLEDAYERCSAMCREDGCIDEAVDNEMRAHNVRKAIVQIKMMEEATA